MARQMYLRGHQQGHHRPTPATLTASSSTVRRSKTNDVRYLAACLRPRRLPSGAAGALCFLFGAPGEADPAASQCEAVNAGGGAVAVRRWREAADTGRGGRDRHGRRGGLDVGGRGGLAGAGDAVGARRRAGLPGGGPAHGGAPSWRGGPHGSRLRRLGWIGRTWRR